MVMYTLEQSWEILRQIDADFGKKKIIFSDKAHVDLRGYINK